MISRQHIRQFLATVDTGSFSRAASSVGVSQPTLSAGIAELERQIGARLFVRERRHVRLTSAGNRLLPLARNIDRDFRKAELDIARAPVQKPIFRIGMALSISAAVTQRLVASLRGERSIELMEGRPADLLQAMQSARIEAAITVYEKTESRALNAMQLYSEPYSLMLPRSHPLSQAIEIDPTDLANQPMIARRSCELLGRTSQFFTERGIRPPIAFKSNNDERVMAMVAASVGATIAPASYFREDVAMLQLRGFRYERAIAFVTPAQLDKSKRLSDVQRDQILLAAKEISLRFAGDSRRDFVRLGSEAQNLGHAD